jgi:hypothetical protein
VAGYGYGASVSGSRTPTVASSTPAPSGIPVASTNNLLVTSEYLGTNRSYAKLDPTTYSGEGGSLASLAFNFFGDNPTWAFIDYDGDNFYYLYTNPSTNPNYIPTTGWSQLVTITAA